LLRRVARPRRRIDGHLARTDALPATDENRKGRDSDQKRRGSNHPPRPGSRHRPFEEDHEIAPYLLLVGPHPHSRALRRSKTRSPRAGRGRFLCSRGAPPPLARALRRTLLIAAGADSLSSRGPQALPKLAGPRPQTERMLRLSWE